jgi:electron transport complex protein RnfA
VYFFFILAGAALINNYVLTQFLGMCPFFGVSKKTETAFGMGVSVLFVMTLASVITFLVYHYLLFPLSIVYMQNVVFILIIASIVEFLEIIMKKFIPQLHATLGIFLPMITTNCIIFGVSLINIRDGFTFIETILNSVGAGGGFLLAMVLLAGVRERYENHPNVPELFRGFPLALFSAGLMSIAFLGFMGLM